MNMDKDTLTRERLKELLHYDPETGTFIWLLPLSKRTPLGSKAGTNAYGYI